LNRRTVYIFIVNSSTPGSHIQEITAKNDLNQEFLSILIPRLKNYTDISLQPFPQNHRLSCSDQINQHWWQITLTAPRAPEESAVGKNNRRRNETSEKWSTAENRRKTKARALSGGIDNSHTGTKRKIKLDLSSHTARKQP
jgi:hypothetical protein